MGWASYRKPSMNDRHVFVHEHVVSDLIYPAVKLGGRWEARR